MLKWLAEKDVTLNLLLHNDSPLGLVKRLFQFGSVGLSGFVVDLIVYSFLMSILGLPHMFARGASYWTAATWNWFWNRNITFDDSHKGDVKRQWAMYMVLCLVSFVPNFGSYYLLTAFIPFFSANTYLAFVIGVGAGFVFNFLGARLVVFRAREHPEA